MAKTTPLPQGITVATHTAGGKTVKKYRVRIRTLTKKANKVFSTLEEAQNYLFRINNSATQEDIIRQTEDFYALENALKELTENPDFQSIYNIYEDRILKAKDDRETSKLALNATKSRLKKMLLADIDISHTDHFLTTRQKKYIKLKDIKLKDFTERTVKEFIKYELTTQKKKKATVQKELTELNKMLKEFCFYNNYDYISPINNANKIQLEKTPTKKRVRYIEEEENIYLQQQLQAQNNKQLRDIILLSIFTSLRRSEIIYLEWKDIYDNYILVEKSKNGESREVYLTAEAKAVIENIDKLPGTNRLFSYTIEGFKTAWQRFRETLKIKRVNFHDFRKAFITTTIQKQIEQSGIANVFALTTALGIKDKDHFNKEYVEREQLKYNHNHRKDFINTEKDLLLNSAHKDYRTNSIYITKLKIK